MSAVDSDDEEVSSAAASSEDEVEQPPPKKRRSPPPRAEKPKEVRKREIPEMKIVSSTSRVPAAGGPADDAFESLLAQQKDHHGSTSVKPEQRPVGELQMSWKIESKKKTATSRDGKGPNANGARRSASKNVFRKMK